MVKLFDNVLQEDKVLLKKKSIIILTIFAFLLICISGCKSHNDTSKYPKIERNYKMALKELDLKYINFDESKVKETPIGTLQYFEIIKDGSTISAAKEGWVVSYNKGEKRITIDYINGKKHKTEVNIQEENEYLSKYYKKKINEMQQKEAKLIIKDLEPIHATNFENSSYNEYVEMFAIKENLSIEKAKALDKNRNNKFISANFPELVDNLEEAYNNIDYFLMSEPFKINNEFKVKLRAIIKIYKSNGKTYIMDVIGKKEDIIIEEKSVLETSKVIINSFGIYIDKGIKYPIENVTVGWVFEIYAYIDNDYINDYDLIHFNTLSSKNNITVYKLEATGIVFDLFAKSIR